MAKLEELSADQVQLEWDTPLFRTAQRQFEQAIPYAEVNESIVERLRYPERAVMVAVPIRREAGHVDVFPAYRVQHSSVLGPTKGGIRYDPHVTLGECAALAVWMTWKCALLRLPYGPIAEDPRMRALLDFLADWFRDAGTRGRTPAVGKLAVVAEGATRGAKVHLRAG